MTGAVAIAVGVDGVDLGDDVVVGVSRGQRGNC